jgi:hypothetical protein
MMPGPVPHRTAISADSCHAGVGQDEGHSDPLTAPRRQRGLRTPYVARVSAFVLRGRQTEEASSPMDAYLADLLV